jgi:hypothetical protein
VFGILAAITLVSGCSVLDQISLNGPPKLDPSRIYLGTSRVMLRGREVEKYACVNSPLLCEGAGSLYQCRCPNAF